MLSMVRFLRLSFISGLIQYSRFDWQEGRKVKIDEHGYAIAKSDLPPISIRWR